MPMACMSQRSNGPKSCQRLLVHEHRQEFEESEVVGEQGVDVVAGAVEELHGAGGEALLPSG